MSVPVKIEIARKFVLAMTGNPKFPTPSPTLTAVTAAINALETAHLAALHGGLDTTANMHAKEHALDLLLKMLGAYVEGIANADPVNAEATIKSAAMELKNGSTRTTKEFEVKVGEPGQVKLSTKGKVRGTFIWQMTTDPTNESSWQTIGMGTQSKFVKNSLTSGMRYHFRVCVVDKNGQGPWSHVLNVIVQ